MIYMIRSINFQFNGEFFKIYILYNVIHFVHRQICYHRGRPLIEAQKIDN
jgi:hypothetical protein